MENEIEKIAELFGLGAENQIEDIQVELRSKVGKDARESAEMGQLSLNENDVDAAIEHFKRAVEQSDEREKDQNICNLASAYEYAGRSVEAVEQLKIVRNRTKNNRESLVSLAEIYYRHGQRKDAEKLLAEAIKFYPNDSDLKLKMAHILQNSGYLQKALTFAEEATRLDAKNSHAHFMAAELNLKLSQPKESLPYYQAAIELSPGDDYLYLRVAIAFWRSEKKVEAIRSIRLCSELDPTKNLYHGVLEAMMLSSGNAEEAAQEESRSKQMDEYDRTTLQAIKHELNIN